MAAAKQIHFLLDKRHMRFASLRGHVLEHFPLAKDVHDEIAGSPAISLFFPTSRRVGKLKSEK